MAQIPGPAYRDSVATCIRQGMRPRALAFSQKYAEALRQSQGSENLAYAEALESTAKLQIELEQGREATETLRTVWAIRARLCPPGDTLLAQAWTNLGLAFVSVF